MPPPLKNAAEKTCSFFDIGKYVIDTHIAHVIRSEMSYFNFYFIEVNKVKDLVTKMCLDII